MSRHRFVGGLFAVMVAHCPVTAFALEASTPDQICAPDADPCIVDQAYVLTFYEYDFGTREVRIVPGGSLQPDSFGDLDILCGSFVLEKGGMINLRARPGFFQGFGSGMVVDARGTCSDNPLAVCDYPGDCPTGQCVGGNVTLDGSVKGPAIFPGDFHVDAAGSITSTGRHDLSRRGKEVSGGGWFALYAEGTVEVTGGFRSRGGGRVNVFGRAGVNAQDVRIDVAGGAYTLGQITFESDEDVTVSGTFKGRPGSDFDMDAGRDATLTAQSDTSETTLNLRGNRSWLGYGGSFGATAGRDVYIDAAVTLDQRYEGGTTAGAISIFGERDVTYGATSAGSSSVYMRANTGTLSVTNTAQLDLDFGENAWGCGFYGGTLLDFAGSLEAVAEKYADEIELTGGTISFSGSIVQHADPVILSTEPSIWVRACSSITFQPGALFTSTAAGGGIFMDAATIVLESGSTIALPASSEIELRHSGAPPALLGEISPTPILTYDEFAGLCP